MRPRILGLDVGERRIGVALSDPLGLTAQRLTTVERRGPRQDALAIARLAQEHQAHGVVVGLPLTMGGEIGEQANKVTAFVESLKPRLSCPIHLMDERLTTAQGQRALLETDTHRRRRKALIDQISAQLILQAYLDANAAAR
jgi:putative Holliday junction resolvase